MVSNFLGKEEVFAYLSDFLKRLQEFESFPTLWCPLTPSGNELLERLLDLISDKYPHFIDKISVLPIYINEKTGKIEFDGKSPSKDISGKNVLVFDSVIHSGSTMTQAISKIIDYGAKSVSTYALAIKRGTSFLPTMWGVMIDDVDRVFLLLNEIPNQRLHAGQGKIKPIHIEQLSGDHLEKPRLICGVKSLDRITWGDRYFDMEASEQGRLSYVLQSGNRILGYLTVHRASNHCMMLDEIAIEKRSKGKGFGGILIRFAHTLARQSHCLFVRLFAIETEVKFYERNNYHKKDGKSISVDGEVYCFMERTIMHNRDCSFL
jgi:GNAT superfamily N-acetyltransferase